MNTALFSALCGVFVLGLLYAELRDSADLRRVFKPLASLAFVLVAVAAGALSSPFGQAVLAGLVLCAAGDLLLIPRAPKFFLAGMAAFAAGHAAFIAAFVIGDVAPSPLVFGTAAAMAAFAAGLFFWLKPGLKAFKIPVLVYAAIISAMVVASVAHWTARPTGQAALLVVAAAAFALSDVAVARDQFLRREFVNRLWGLPLYYAAQCLFAINV